MDNLVKQHLLEKAIEVAKEYARGTDSHHPENVLENVYNKLKELWLDTEK